MTWVAGEYSVEEGDGSITVELQLNGVIDPTEEEVWVSLYAEGDGVAIGKLLILM